MSTVLVVALGRMGGGISMQGGQQHLAGDPVALLGNPLLVLQDNRPGFLRQFGLEHRQESLLRLLPIQAAQVVQRLTLQVQQLGQFFVAPVGVLQSLGQSPLCALDDPFLLAQIVGLLFDRLLRLSSSRSRSRSSSRILPSSSSVLAFC